MLRKAQNIYLTNRQEEILKQISSSRTIEVRYQQRAQLILELSAGATNKGLVKKLGINRATVKKWRKRWYKAREKLTALEQEENANKYKNALLEILNDAPRSGAPPKFTPEQVCQIVSVACEPPDESGHMVSHWSYQSLADEVVKRGIVECISKTQVCVFLKSDRY